MRYQSKLVVSLFLVLSINCSAQKKAADISVSEPTLGEITETAKLSEARAHHSATRLSDGTVVVIGGMERNGVFFDTAEVFNPKTNKFTTARGKMTRPRVGHTATLLPGGKILIVGGWSNRNAPEATAEIYDPATEKFTPIGSTHLPLSGHIAAFLDNGKVLIAGGSDGKVAHSDFQLFDPASNSFSVAGKMPGPRNAPAVSKLSDGRILLTGGESTRGQILKSGETYDPRSNKFASTGPMNVVRYKHDSILLGDGRVLIFGGSDNRDWNGQYRSAEIYNPKTNRFSPTGDMNFTRFKVEGSAVLLENGKVFIGGGNKTAEIFDPETKSFKITAGDFGMPLYFASVTLLDGDRALIVGGYGYGTRQTGPVSTNRAWIFNLQRPINDEISAR